MPRMNRIVNYTATSKDTWYKAFDAGSYKGNRIREVRVKLREDTTADHFRYNFDGAATPYMTSSGGFITLRDIQKLYIYVPDQDSQVLEIEAIYK